MVTLLTYVCLTGATLGVLACLAIRYRREIAIANDTICSLSPTKKAALLIMLIIAVAHGGGKTNTEDNVDGGLTNLLTGAFRSLAHFIDPENDFQYPPVTDEDIAFGWQRLGPFTNSNVVYTMPDGAALATNWWLRGAFKDVAPISNLWAYVWGKVRFALADTNEIVAVGAPMSAIPLSSRLWSAADTNGAFRITWENFTLGRAQLTTNNQQLTTLSAQIEFRANGDYVTRSNEIETVWRHIDPNDFDGDGYRNEDDPNPLEWDDGADTYYGPCNDLPWGCNEDAYCDVTVEIGGSYTYEGYTVFFSGINCGCHYTTHDNTTFGLTAPSAVFKDGALRPLEITFHHGDIYDPEEGELTLEVVRGGDKIRLWEDPEKTWEATSPWWYVSSFDGCTLYIEGLEKSRQADDIRFRLTWTRPGGSSAYADATTTCAEVKETQVTSFTPGITDGSSNQQPFAGHTNWDFDVTHRSLWTLKIVKTL